MEFTRNGKRYRVERKLQPDGRVIAADLFRLTPPHGPDGDSEFWPKQRLEWRWLGGWAASA